MHEVELNRAGLLDFDFFDIKYDVDGDGEVYPDVYSEFGKGVDDKRKKVKKVVKFPIESLIKKIKNMKHMIENPQY
jgi:hypothetical protein